MKGFLPGDTVFLIRQRGHRKEFRQVMVYSVSRRRGQVKLHGHPTNFRSDGKPIGQPSWAPSFWIEPITPGLMDEIRNAASQE